MTGSPERILPSPETGALLEVASLRVHLFTRWGVVKAAEDVSFSVAPGETLGLVGESGSGKTMACLAILRLLPAGGRILGGRILLEGEDLLAKSERAMRSVRGKRISMILQDPQTSLNPLFTVGEQVAEPIRLHRRDVARAGVRDVVMEALRRLAIPDPSIRARSYPYQLSGGMRQRVMGAIALSCAPKLLIADEPTTSLDVTVQAQYLELLRSIQEKHNVSIIFVTHDLGIVAQLCHHVAVMYAGRVVETLPVRKLFDAPAHPYTIALLNSSQQPTGPRRRLTTIPGQPPALNEPLPACAFAARCSQADQVCYEQQPPLVQLGERHSARCWRLVDGGATH
jgi:oligopeptide/dipeptide ABC transporter ATP-binding protein